MAQTSVNVPMEKRVDLMMEKEKIKNQRLEMERELKQIQETQDCTFKPKIIGKRQKKANLVPEKYREPSPEHSPAGPVHSRLYTLASRPKKVKDYPTPAEREERELRECTFTPNINHANQRRTPKPKVEKPAFKSYRNPQPTRDVKSAKYSEEVPGYGDAISRLRRA